MRAGMSMVHSSNDNMSMHKISILSPRSPQQFDIMGSEKNQDIGEVVNYTNKMSTLSHLRAHNSYDSDGQSQDQSILKNTQQVDETPPDYNKLAQEVIDEGDLESRIYSKNRGRNLKTQQRKIA